MRLTLHTFDEASKKSGTNSNIQQTVTPEENAFNKINFVSSRYADLDCIKAANNHALSKMTKQLSNRSWNKVINDEIESQIIRCQTAKNVIFQINDTLMLLVVLAACAINMIFQSATAVCNGMFILKNH